MSHRKWTQDAEAALMRAYSLFPDRNGNCRGRTKKGAPKLYDQLRVLLQHSGHGSFTLQAVRSKLGVLKQKARSRVLPYIVLSGAAMPGGQDAGVLVYNQGAKGAARAGVVTIRDFAMSGRKTVQVGSSEYYAEMISMRRLWSLLVTYDLRLSGAPVDAQEPRREMERLGRAMPGRINLLGPNRQQILVVGPAKQSQNECLLQGTAYAVLDAEEMPAAVDRPSWVGARIRENPSDRYLLLLSEVQYIGRSTLPLACYNGQSPVTFAVPAALHPHVDSFPCWTPPFAKSGAIVSWNPDVGPGSTYSLDSQWFNEGTV
jgi:hypothetical protein